jgi:hypothetical protein
MLKTAATKIFSDATLISYFADDSKKIQSILSYRGRSEVLSLSGALFPFWTNLLLHYLPPRLAGIEFRSGTEADIRERNRLNQINDIKKE